MQNQTDPITAGLKAGEALLNVIEKAIPSDAERLERLRARAPLRAIRLQSSLFNRRLKKIKRIRRFMKREKLTEQQVIELLNLTNVISER